MKQSGGLENRALYGVVFPKAGEVVAFLPDL